jgi:hypothetical protein
MMLLYTSTIFVSAFLLFQIQPMIAKMILPWFGGSAAVWITAMLFFQIVLLAGYLYAHWSSRSLGPKAQARLHAGLLLASLAFLPIWPSQGWKPTGAEQPMLRILCLLVMSVGLPYFLLSSTSSLVQVWYSRKFRKILPYRLFALSNLASLLGLLAYPFLLEPNSTLRQQSVCWSAAYAVFILLCSASALVSSHNPGLEPLPDQESPSAREAAAPPGQAEQTFCLLLACCASALMLAVTNHLTQNVASIPFLWILPLSLYLLSFILTFDVEWLYRRKLFVWLLSFALVGMSYALSTWNSRTEIRQVIFVFSAGLFLCCLFCHGEIVKRKPAPRYLTSFYLTLSAGGALGGLLVGLVAPLVLPGYFELPVALLACALLMFLTIVRGHARWTTLLSLAAVAAVCYGQIRYLASYSRTSEVMARNFYGSLRVMLSGRGSADEQKTLVHGAVIHGSQFTSPGRRFEHTTYYGARSGVGLALQSLRGGTLPSGALPSGALSSGVLPSGALSSGVLPSGALPSGALPGGAPPSGGLRVGVIGLGAGSLASFAEPGDFFRFYEINPLVEKLARSEFSYLNECRGKVEVVIGDGRLSLEAEQPQGYDLLVVDAFSGDAIPVHLLTVQALELYFKHLKPDGILALHITNSHLDLQPVVDRLAGSLGKAAAVVVNKDARSGTVSDWALLSSKPGVAPQIAAVAARLESRPQLRVWTDDYNNLFQILK